MKYNIFKQVVFIIIVSANLALATTYHVRTAGHDTDNGTTWGTAWATINKVNNTITTGDTVLFGAGRWLNAQIVLPRGGTFNNRTVYACSTMASDTWHTAIISGGTLATGWTVHSGNIYRANWTGTGCYYSSRSYTLTQNDSLMKPETSVAAINQQGEFYHDGSTIYAWPYGNINPNTQEMIASCKPPLYIDETDMDHILFYGIDLRMGKQGVVYFSAGADSVFFVHCKFSREGYMAAENSTLIFSSAFYGSNADSWGSYNSFIGCSFSDVTAEGSGPTHSGSAADLYTQRYVLFDSCLVNPNGMMGEGFAFKMAGYGDNGVNSTGNVVRYCMMYNFREEGIWINSKCEYDSVYGNVIVGAEHQAIKIGGSTAMSDPEVRGNNFICNNTFYNCSQFTYWRAIQDATGGNIVKYNIGYGIVPNPDWDSYFHSFVDAGNSPPLHTLVEFDENCWYDPDGASFRANFYYSNYANWTAWRNTYGFDVNGLNSDPGFANPEAYDFSRPNSLDEMNLTYGGRTWTRWGAWQPPSEPDDDPPQISGVGSNNVSDISATVIWHTNEYATSQVFYGLTSAYGDSTSLNHLRVLNHAVNLTDLQANTLYHFQVSSIDASGNEASSGDYTFQTTAADTIPPVISNVASSGVTDVSAAITWTTNEPATSRVQYGLTFNYELATPLDTGLVLNHQVNLTSLIPDTLYYFRVLSRDARNNERISAGYSFHTDTVSTYQNLALLDTLPRVCGTYEGYTIDPINDGIIAPYGGESTTWASDDSITVPHWIVIDFGGPVYDVESVVVFWAWNAYSSTWMCSRQYQLQYWNESTNGYADAAVVNNSSADSVTATTFPAVTTSRMRYLQPAGMGPQTYPSILWITELEIYGSEADSGGPIYTPTPIMTVIDTADFQVTLIASTVECEIPIYYEFALDSLPDFPEPMFRVPLIVDTVASVTYDSLSDEVLYYWRCRAVATDESDSSDWSDSTCFNIITGIVQSLTTADCLYPLDGAVVHASRPIFTIHNIRNIDYYYIQVDDDPLFTSPTESGPVVKTSASVTNWQITDPLEQGQAYFWRVSGGNNVWTSPLHFTADLDIHSYPNPFRSSAGYPTITFTNLPQDAKIVISTISGKIVKRQNDIGPGDWIWDVKNDNGDNLAPGVYPFNVDYPSGSSSGKVVVIK